MQRRTRVCVCLPWKSLLHMAHTHISHPPPPLPQVTRLFQSGFMCQKRFGFCVEKMQSSRSVRVLNIPLDETHVFVCVCLCACVLCVCSVYAKNVCGYLLKRLSDEIVSRKQNDTSFLSAWISIFSMCTNIYIYSLDAYCECVLRFLVVIICRV